MFLKRFWPSILALVLFISTMFFLLKFFGIDSFHISDRSAIISAFVAVFVFGGGLIYQMISNRIKQCQKDKQLKRVFIVNLKTILDGLNYQIENYKEIINTLKSVSIENVMLSSFAELDYFELNKIPSEDLFRIFIDFQKGEEKDKISRLENLRKELRFIETSRDMINNGFEKLYDSINNHSEKVLDGILEVGQFFDRETTRILHSKANPDSDLWFNEFAKLYGETKLLLKISDETYTDYDKIETKIVPKFYDFALSNMEDPRTPIITEAFSKISSSIFTRKDAIKNLIKFVEYYLEKYEQSKSNIEKAIKFYEENE